MDSFIDNLQDLMKKYYGGPLEKQLEELDRLKTENEDQWQQIVPRMEGLQQMKTIYRNTFNHHRSAWLTLPDPSSPNLLNYTAT